MSHQDEELQVLRDKDRVLQAMERMLRCERRGLCLLKEWMRRYGNPGNGCACYYFFSETYLDDRPRELDL